MCRKLPFVASGSCAIACSPACSQYDGTLMNF
jgi:hypothetical protein